ncbi:MAG: rhodanese-like domain-containing protein [Gammaproteobacteria bacterium]
MLNRLPIFASNHYLLVAAFVFILVLIVADEVERRTRRYREIGAQEATQLINRGASLLDLRDRKTFDEGHIANAVRINADDLRERIPALAKSNPPAIILCCQNGEQSKRSAKQAAGLSSTPVAVLKNGITQWKQENFPLVQKSRGQT